MTLKFPAQLRGDRTIQVVVKDAKSSLRNKTGVKPRNGGR